MSHGGRQTVVVDLAGARRADEPLPRQGEERGLAQELQRVPSEACVDHLRWPPPQNAEPGRVRGEEWGAGGEPWLEESPAPRVSKLLAPIAELVELLPGEQGDEHGGAVPNTGFTRGAQ